MKFQFSVLVYLLLTTITTFSQNKKNQIEILNYKVDSLVQITISDKLQIKNNNSNIIDLENQIRNLKASNDDQKTAISEIEKKLIEKNVELKKKELEVVFLSKRVQNIFDSLDLIEKNTISSSEYSDVDSEITIDGHNNSFQPLTFEHLPKNIQIAAESCTDCCWFNHSDELIGDLFFVHDPEEDKLYFVFNKTEFIIPVKYRELESEELDGEVQETGKLAFEGSGFKIIYEFYHISGHGWGEEGTVEIFYNQSLIKTMSIRSTLN